MRESLQITHIDIAVAGGSEVDLATGSIAREHRD